FRRPLPDVAAVSSFWADAGESVLVSLHELRGFVGLKVSPPGARPGHFSQSQRAGLRLRRADGDKPDAGGGKRKQVDPAHSDRADGRECKLCGDLLDAT